jgi:hypothetical protein
MGRGVIPMSAVLPSVRAIVLIYFTGNAAPKIAVLSDNRLKHPARRFPILESGKFYGRKNTAHAGLAF